MKIIKPFFLLFICCSVSLNLFASHGAGATVWYKSTGNNKYDVYVDYYRDCRGIPMPSDPDLYIRNISGSASTKATLTPVSITEITNVCPAGKKCGSPNTIYSGNGVEKHTYKVSIDLSTWKSAGVCQVLLGVGQCCRANDITTGAAAQDMFVWSMLDLCKGAGNNSAMFADEPSPFLTCNSVVRMNYGASDYKDNDSLVYDMVDPMYDFVNKTKWAGSFSYQIPFSVYWPFGYDKSKGPNPSLDPPAGFYLNRLTGDMIFSPIDCSESTIFALRVSEYRKDSSGKYNLVGYVTRDYQTFVRSGTGNNVPTVKVSDNIYITDNIKTCFTVSSDDSPYKPSSGSPIKNDTTKLIMFPFTPKGNTSATFTIRNLTAKLESAEVCWYPKGLASNTPYQMIFKVMDNSCSASPYGSSCKTVNVYVQKPKNVAWIEGTVYLDKNKNCTLDSNETPLPNQEIVFGSGSIYGITTDSSGHFERAIMAGNYTFKVYNKYGEFVCSKTINVQKGNTYKFDLGALPKMHITGTIYKDDSKNCKFETTEPIWANHIVYTEPGNYSASTDANGKYDLRIPAGDYKIRVKTTGSNFFVKCPLVPFVSSSIDTLFTNQNIAVFDSSNIADASTKVISAYSYNRGGDHEVTVIVKNNGSRYISSANVWLKFNKKLKYVSATSYVFKTDTTIKWNFTNLAAGKELRFYAVLNADASTCQINDTMILFSWLDTAGLGEEVNIANNYDKHKIKITGKTVPNVKEELLTNGYTWRERNKLRYYIQFRNTGTKAVNNVIVTDTLPFPISGSSFQMLGASHANTYSISNNVLKVSFTGINLPDSSSDKIKSKGYFEFTAEIDTRTNTEIKFYNKAEIQFDTSKVIKTNKVYNNYVSYVSTGKTNANIYCLNDSLKVSYSSKFQFNSGNKFRLILSNPDGEFDSKTTVLDSVGSTSLTGNFKTKIPSSIVGGINYKVKVVSTNPYSKELSNGISNSFKIYTSAYKPFISVKDTLVCNKDSIQITINSLLDSLNIYDRKILITSLSNASSIKLKLPSGKHYLTATRKVSASCSITSDTLFFKNDTMSRIDLICTSHSKSYACFGDTLKLKATNAFSYDFYDDANKFLAQNNSGIFSNIFDYSISNFIYVIGKSRYGCRDTSKVFTIAMRDPLPPDVQFSDADLTLCKNQSITVTGSGVAGYSSYQLFRNNKSWLNSFTSTISTTDIADKDSIKIKGTDGYGCSNFSKTYGFKVNDFPIVKMTCTDSTLCDGINSNLTTFNFTGATSYKLYKNGSLFSGVSGSSTSPYNIKNKDYFYGEGTDAIGCKGMSNSISIDVINANISINVNKGGPVCDGDSIRFEFKGGVSYELYKNKLLWQTINKQQFVIRSMTQNDSVYTKGTDSFGCKATTAKYGFNIVKTPPIIISNFNHTNNSHCEGEDVVINITGMAKHDLFKNGTIWKPAIGTSITFKDVIDKDEIYATGIAANGCKGISNTIKFTVWPIPSKPLITQSGITLTSNYTSGNQWYDDINKITGAINQKYSPPKFGNYFVKHTSLNGCESPLSDKFNYTTGVLNTEKPFFKIYPNPASDYIKIETGLSAHYKIRLIDITGKLVKEDSFIGNSYEWHFKLGKGIYQMVISNEKGQVKTQSLEIN